MCTRIKERGDIRGGNKVIDIPLSAQEPYPNFFPKVPLGWKIRGLGLTNPQIRQYLQYHQTGFVARKGAFSSQPLELHDRHEQHNLCALCTCLPALPTYVQSCFCLLQNGKDLESSFGGEAKPCNSLWEGDTGCRVDRVVGKPPTNVGLTPY